MLLGHKFELADWLIDIIEGDSKPSQNLANYDQEAQYHQNYTH